MSRKITVLGCLALVAAFVLVGCSSSVANPLSLQVVKIAAAGPISGQYAKIGLDAANAVRFAVDEFNASPAAVSLGIKVEVEIADDEGDPAKGMTIADRLGQENDLVAVVGPMNSSVVNAILPIYQRAGLPMVSQAATTSDLSEQGYSVFYRICPRDDKQGPAAARFIANDLQVKQVVLVDDKGTYGQGLAEQVAGVLNDLGVATERMQITQADRDFAPLVTLLRARQPDLVYLALSSPAQAGIFVKQARVQGLNATFMGGEAIREEVEFVQGAEGKAEGVYITAISPDLESTNQGRQFQSAYTAKYGGTSLFTGQSYEAAKVVLAAIEQAARQGKVDRQGVIKALQQTNYQGVLGFPIIFNAKGDLSGASIFVEKVENGKFAPVKVLP